MILDGWGDRVACKDNAITMANPENFNYFNDKYPSCLLKCSGKDVGLPAGQMGNSEVGHLNIGSGRIVYQEITRISNAIEDNSFYSNPEFNKAIEYARNNQGALHLMGLLSDGGVHSHKEHLYALLHLAKINNFKRVYIHAFLDGRDVGPKTALEYLNALQTRLNEIGIGVIATVGGRFYAMDRDKRWERIEKAYNAMVLGQGNKAPNFYAAIQDSYDAKITDEFIEPVVIIDDNGRPIGTINDGDSLIFFNFRADRARQITRSLVDDTFTAFKRIKKPKIYFVCMTQYDINIKAPIAFMPQDLKNTLGEVLAQHGLKQLRIAETEKYAHVTFFFNGGVEEPNPGEDRIMIPSPNVETYNLQPEMSANQVTERVIQEIKRNFYDVIILNYANPDMVGHTGVLEAATEAIKTVDHCLGKVVNAVMEQDGAVLITADHGNCEMMKCPETGMPLTSHTTNKVPFIFVANRNDEVEICPEGSLQDIAPTILELLGIDKPTEMTGKSIIKQKQLITIGNK